MASGLLDSFRTWAWQNFLGAGMFLFHLLIEPFFQTLLGILRHIEKAQPDMSFDIGPGYFRFHVQSQSGFGQSELQARRSAWCKMRAIPPSLILVLVAFSSLSPRSTLTSILTGWR
jgi:hypothetical protein